MYKAALNQRLEKLLKQQRVERQIWLQQTTALPQLLQVKICSSPVFLVAALLATMLVWWPAKSSADHFTIKPTPSLARQTWGYLKRLARLSGI